MKGNPEDRAILLAENIIETQNTVRQAAKIFGISKSTVHKDVTTRLKHMNKGLYLEVQKVLMNNKSERHIRGGLATQEKYLCMQSSHKQKQVSHL